MTKTEMLETMKRLDAHANALLLIGASDIDLLGGMFDVMPDFKALLDAGYGEEIERNAGRFPGLHRYAVMLSNIAEGIADGSIRVPRSEEHTSELQSLMRISYAVFCLKKKTTPRS